MKLPKSGARDTYSFDVDLSASRYITLVVTDTGALSAMPRSRPREKR
jgi:hypothetical protein